MARMIDGTTEPSDRPGALAARKDRAQTLLVGAVGLAVLFVSLALVLNSAIHGATLASEATRDVQGGETILLQEAVYGDVAEVVREANADNGARLDIKTQIADDVALLDARYQRYYAQHDRVVGLTTAGLSPHVDGQRIFQTTTRQFTTDAVTPAPNWTLATNARVRAFDVDVDGWGDKTDDNFSIVFDDGTQVRRVQIYNETVGGSPGTEITLEEGGTDTFTCSVADATPAINVTDAKVNGEHCNALDFHERVDGEFSEVAFEFGNEISGTYTLTASVAAAPPSAPNSETQVYSTTVNLTERSLRIDYGANLRVAPGEPR